jgi:branched-chain amino acid transport system ATP-binding protein
MLKVSQLVTSYGGIDALRGVDLHVARGTVTTLIGANGAGKTTLINTVTGVVRAQSGSIEFDGQEISQLPSHQVARMGLVQVPEGRRIFAPFTVRENLELGWQALGKRGTRREQDFDRVFELFPKLAERQGQLGGSLSGGEQQMLAIGRALMARPKMLLLDEPSLGLSPLLVTLVFEAIARLASEGLTLLLVEQNARKALDAATYAFVLERGLITIKGSAVDVRNDPAIVKAYLGAGSQVAVEP